RSPAAVRRASQLDRGTSCSFGRTRGSRRRPARAKRTPFAASICAAAIYKSACARTLFKLIAHQLREESLTAEDPDRALMIPMRSFIVEERPDHPDRGRAVVRGELREVATPDGVLGSAVESWISRRLEYPDAAERPLTLDRELDVNAAARAGTGDL